MTSPSPGDPRLNFLQRMFVRLATEVAGERSALGDEVRGLFSSFASMLEQLFLLARRQGELAAEIDPRRFALSVVCLPISFMSANSFFGEPYEGMEAELSSILTRGLSRA